MSIKFSKRGKNPGAVDCWLDSLGYYRKNVAYDETCLFRAVAEQLYDTQIRHEDVRKACISYGKRNSKEFQHLFPKRRDWFERLQKLAIHMVICTETEIQLVCNTFQVDLTVFNGNNRNIHEFRGHSLYHGNKNLFLCKMGDDHFDAVYTKDHIAIAGLCQSIIYNVVYEHVFGMQDIDSIVHSMLHDKQAPLTVYCPEAELVKESFSIDDHLDSENSNDSRHTPSLAPFPFKIAKALDPSIYRNIEYDTWLELRRELRLGDWYYGDDKLILGTRCILTRNDQEYQCYIQEIYENDTSRCQVYITKLAQRLTVNYCDLRPEDGAKPWPLPYRFARNQTITLPNLDSPVDNERKGSLRKRREKKHLQSLSDESVHSQDGNINIANYEGCPLLMQNSSNESAIEHLNGLIQTSTSISDPQLNNAGEPANTPEQMHWSQTTGDGMELYSTVTSMESSMPNASSHLVYSYENEPSYTSLPVWSTPNHIVLTPDSTPSDIGLSSPVDCRNNAPKYMYENSYAPPAYLPSPVLSAAPHYPSNFNDRLICSNPTTSISSPVDSFPVYPMVSPGTPVYYTPIAGNQVQTAMRSEYVVPGTPHLPMCSPPPIELQYVTSPTFVYPPTPPVAWYNPGINSQGFVFPAPLTGQTQNTN